jgi:hypothetical protein
MESTFEIQDCDSSVNVCIHCYSSNGFLTIRDFEVKKNDALFASFCQSVISSCPGQRFTFDTNEYMEIEQSDQLLLIFSNTDVSYFIGIPINKNVIYKFKEIQKLLIVEDVI